MDSVGLQEASKSGDRDLVTQRRSRLTRMSVTATLQQGSLQRTPTVRIGKVIPVHMGSKKADTPTADDQEVGRYPTTLIQSVRSA